MGYRINRSALVIALIATSACSTIQRGFENRRGYYTDNTPDLRTDDVARFGVDQNENMNRFVVLSGVSFERREIPIDLLPPAPSGTRPGQVLPPIPTYLLAPVGDNWRPVIDAGMHYVDVRCQRYIDALFALNRIREGASRELRDMGAASAAALTVLHASMELIGLAPLAFGLLDQTVNNIGRGLLYELPPTVVQTLVREQQIAYVTAMETKTYTTRTVALRTIQGYAALCLPASIESEVNRAITAQRFQPVNYGPPPAPKPAAAPAAAPAAPAAEGPPQIEPVPQVPQAPQS